MYQDILLPTDGGDGVERVAEHAGSLARQYDATVHILSVADTRNRFEGPSMGLGGDAWEDAERERGVGRPLRPGNREEYARDDEPEEAAAADPPRDRPTERPEIAVSQRSRASAGRARRASRRRGG